MKNIAMSLMALSLFGCSISAQQPPVATQTKDLRDFDSDGVINARDKCADTPLGAVVDNDGCPTYVKTDEKNSVHVLFANDSTVIPETYMVQLKKTAQFLETFPETHIELKGYASPVGNSAHNQYLSDTRAANVRQQLIDFGVAADRIKTVGFGDADPIQAETSEASNTLSRRVVAQVVGSKGHVVDQWTIFTVREN
ncbi:OmpA family protein [Photobacterium damselae]|uniref:OmpA family protein n=1 Tax=Photobacterium damselae TaxID=38293 RepID=UPI000E02FA7A|nr:Outer membrane porin F [Photobacterium damselae subsp. damselae]SUB90562.1 Outer membrane porin F precursor [Photobacterium damselae]